MHEVLVNRLEGLSLPRKSVVRLTDRPDMTLDVYRGRKKNNTTTKIPIHPKNKNNYLVSVSMSAILHSGFEFRTELQTPKVEETGLLPWICSRD